MENYRFSFERLDVWQLAKKLTVRIFKETKSFPHEERFGIISQINRAAISVPANIAEGSSRFGFKSQTNFYSIAYSSLMELTSHLFIANELEFLKDTTFSELKISIFEISNKLNALHKSQRSKQFNNSTT